ncbi:MAG: Ig-like domain-containing protein [Puniceicoccaceae bacterium]
MTHPMRQFAILLSLGLACSLPVQGQLVVEDEQLGEVITNFTVDQDVLGGGGFYYQIIEEETEITVARGKMDADGLDRIILAPLTTYRMVAFYEETLSLGVAVFTTPASGRQFEIPTISYEFIPGLLDTDGDELPNPLEEIAGTKPDNPDTDGDGFPDGREVMSGQDPLDGFIVEVGIIASGPTSAAASDICAINNLAVVALGANGVAVFNVRNGTEPVRVAEVNTPGHATSVSCFGNLVAVADGPGGLVVIDISDPAGSSIVRQTTFRRPAVAVVTRGSYAYVGLDTGDVLMVDMLTGEEIARYEGIVGTVQDMGIREDVLYVLTQGNLHALDLRGDALTYLKSTISPGSIGAGRFRLRLYVGDDFLYASYLAGYNIIDISDPRDPVHVRQHASTERGWKQIVATGTGLAVATVSPNSTRDGPHNVNLYNVGEDNRETAFLRTFETPGIATAVAIYNALAYVADDSGGLQVINYASFDTLGIPPELTVRHSGIDGQVEEGKVLSVAVDVTDDVQVRNVQFFIDEEPVAVDGNFPFEIGIVAPLLTPEKTFFSLHVVASDTGGNATRSDTIELELVPDATPPVVRRFLPRNGSVIGSLDASLITFSEPINPDTANGVSISLEEAGSNGVHGDFDDIRVDPSDYIYQEATLSILLPHGQLEPGFYRLSVGPEVEDLAGNPMEGVQHCTFRIFGFEDRDADGVPDDLEEFLGLDPDNPDSNNNGIRDGDEDFDRDGLTNSGEIIMQTDLKDEDTDGDGIKDGDEDTDFDGLNDGLESMNRTDPCKVDTDGDGIDDGSEIADGLDPLDPASAYPETVVSLKLSFLNEILSEADNNVTFSITAPMVSYLNTVVSAIDAESLSSVSSPMVSFLNSILSPADLEETSTTYSPLVSYLNNLIDEVAEELSLFYASGVVSYENQTGQ